MNSIHIFLTSYLAVLGYLWITNVFYVIKKNEQIDRKCRKDRAIRLSKIWSEVFRTAYLTLAGFLVGLKWWEQDTDKDGYFEDLEKFPCRYYKYVSLFAMVSVVVFLRILHVCSRLYATRRMLGMRPGRTSIVVMGLLLAWICGVLVLVETGDWAEKGEYDSHPTCSVRLPFFAKVFWISTISVFELLMLWLYMKPLLEIDLGNGGGLWVVFFHTSLQSEKKQPLMDDYHGMCVKRIHVLTPRPAIKKLPASAEMLMDYHHCVRRNFWCGVLSLVMSVQYLVIYIVVAPPTHSGLVYWYSGIGIIHFCVSFIIIYICLTMSDRDWLQAFVPCRCPNIRKESFESNEEIQQHPTVSGGLIFTVSGSDSETEYHRDKALESIKDLMRSIQSNHSIEEKRCC